MLIKYNSNGNAQWAKNVTTGTTTSSRFNSIATDTSGNVYAVGYMYGSGTYNFGNSVTVAGTYSSGNNIVLVKYDSNGNAQWAKSVTAGSGGSQFNSVITDSSGSICAAGFVTGSGTYNFGNSITATGTSPGDASNVVLVKYDSNGNALWAKSVTTVSGNSSFQSITIDTGGNIYATGIIHMYYGTENFDFGNGVTVTGTASGVGVAGNNVVLVKYDNNGNAQWARSITAGANGSGFNAITTDASGNIYAAGYIYGSGTYGFGNNVTVAGTYTLTDSSAAGNVVLVKYNSNGNAQWARSVTAGAAESRFNAITTDTSGNIYAAGFIYGGVTFDFGNGATVVGIASQFAPVLVKYGEPTTTTTSTTTTTTTPSTTTTPTTTTSTTISTTTESLTTESSGDVTTASTTQELSTTATTVGGSTTIVSTTEAPITTAQTTESLTTAVSDTAVSTATTAVTTEFPTTTSSGGVTTASTTQGLSTTATTIGGATTTATTKESLTTAPPVITATTTAASITTPTLSSLLTTTSVGKSWAKSVITGSSDSEFKSMITDASGNVYAAGYIYGTGTYNFGNGISVTGVHSGSNHSGNNTVLVKYDNSGNAQWAKSVTTGAGLYGSEFNSITTDINGNVYAAGYIFGTGTYNFGNGVTVAGTYSGHNVVLVKYDSNGNTQWAKSVMSVGSLGFAEFYSVTTDTSGNIYAAGYMSALETYNFGNGVTVTGTNNTSSVLVKYDSNGNARWAKSVTAGSNESKFHSIATDISGNIYAVGYIDGDGIYTFGNGVTISGTSSDRNVVLVKYYSNGNTRWAKSVTAGLQYSEFKSITTDVSGNVYAVGSILGTGTYDFGSGVTVAGAYSGSNIVLVKYDSNGNAQWAKSVAAGAGTSLFNSVVADTNGNVYAIGYMGGTGTYSFGNGVAVAGTSSTNNIVLVKYGANGNAWWAKSVIAGLGTSLFNSVTTDTNANVYAAGYIYGTGVYNFGDDLTVTGTSSSHNAVLVKYEEPVTTTTTSISEVSTTSMTEVSATISSTKTSSVATTTPATLPTITNGTTVVQSIATTTKPTALPPVSSASYQYAPAGFGVLGALAAILF